MPPRRFIHAPPGPRRSQGDFDGNPAASASRPLNPGWTDGPPARAVRELPTKSAGLRRGPDRRPLVYPHGGNGAVRMVETPLSYTQLLRRKPHGSGVPSTHGEEPMNPKNRNGPPKVVDSAPPGGSSGLLRISAGGPKRPSRRPTVDPISGGGSSGADGAGRGAGPVRDNTPWPG